MSERTGRVMWCVLMCVVVATAALAQEAPEMTAEQEAMMKAWQEAMTPGPQHAHMAEMVGEFKITVKTYNGPDAEPEVMTGTASRRMIMGGRYLEETVHSSYMGQPFEGRSVTGFNNVTGTWWGTWIDNMSTGIMTSHGEWNEDTGVGVFYGEYVDPMTKEIQETRTVVKQLEGGDELMESYMTTPTGEFKSMDILYERQ